MGKVSHTHTHTESRNDELMRDTHTHTKLSHTRREQTDRPCEDQLLKERESSQSSVWSKHISKACWEKVRVRKGGSEWRSDIPGSEPEGGTQPPTDVHRTEALWGTLASVSVVTPNMNRRSQHKQQLIHTHT